MTVFTTSYFPCNSELPVPEDSGVFSVSPCTKLNVSPTCIQSRPFAIRYKGIPFSCQELFQDFTQYRGLGLSSPSIYCGQSILFRSELFNFETNLLLNYSTLPLNQSSPRHMNPGNDPGMIFRQPVRPVLFENLPALDYRIDSAYGFIDAIIIPAHTAASYCCRRLEPSLHPDYCCADYGIPGILRPGFVDLCPILNGLPPDAGPLLYRGGIPSRDLSSLFGHLPGTHTGFSGQEPFSSPFTGNSAPMDTGFNLTPDH